MVEAYGTGHQGRMSGMVKTFGVVTDFCLRYPAPNTLQHPLHVGQKLPLSAKLQVPDHGQ